MFEFGFIGFGSMAKMLIHGLIDFSKVNPGSICATRNNKSKLHEIGDMFPGVSVYDTCRGIAENARIVFLCVKAAEMKGVLHEIKPVISNETHIVSIAGSISLDNLESILQGKISRFIPTITSEVGAGISLICHNENVTNRDAELLEKRICALGKFKTVKESDMGFAAELTSCAPGFIASVFGHFVNAASMHTSSFNVQEISEMVIETLFATSKLLAQTGMSFNEVITRVATKGGITQEGVAVFNETLPAVFDDMFKNTMEKRRVSAEKIDRSFQNK